MKEITDRQTFVISVNLFTFLTTGAGVETKSQVQLPMNLRFAAEEVIHQMPQYRTFLILYKYGVI